MPYSDDPATKGQLTQLTNLARKWRRPAPRANLTYDEAAQAIRLLRNYRLMESDAMPTTDPDLAPGMTLRHWFPYRRNG